MPGRYALIQRGARWVPTCEEGDAMTTGHAGMVGHAPRVLIRPIEPNLEREKYRKLWEIGRASCRERV